MTDLDAANKALMLLGVDPIGALGDETKAARTMNRLIDSTLKAVLGEYPWTFALRLSPLIESGASSAPGWRYAYIKPSAAAYLYQVYAEINRKVQFITVGSVISTMERGVNVEYTDINTSLSAFTNSAAEAFVARLASDGAKALTGDAQMASTLFEKYLYLVQQAKGDSVREEHVQPMNADDYVRVRY